MTIFWCSLGLTLALMAVTLQIGGPQLFGWAVAATLLPHVFIGDLFHWSHFPKLSSSRKRLWMVLTVFGVGVFLFMRQSGSYMLPLFYIYFFGHFWKDLDLGLGQLAGDPSAGSIRRPKRWCGALLFVAYAVISSGLIRDPTILITGRKFAWLGALLLAAIGLRHLWRFRTSGQSHDLLWFRYATFSACFLLLCACLHAQHPFRQLLPEGIIVWHYTLWYAFYWSLIWKETSVFPTAAPRRGLDWLKHSLAGLATLIIVINGLSVAGAWLYMQGPHWDWLRYVYNYRYLAGCWVVMHVTWDWLPKQIRGVRLAVI